MFLTEVFKFKTKILLVLLSYYLISVELTFSFCWLFLVRVPSSTKLFLLSVFSSSSSFMLILRSSSSFFLFVSWRFFKSSVISSDSFSSNLFKKAIQLWLIKEINLYRYLKLRNLLFREIIPYLSLSILSTEYYVSL